MFHVARNLEQLRGVHDVGCSLHHHLPTHSPSICCQSRLIEHLFFLCWIKCFYYSLSTAVGSEQIHCSFNLSSWTECLIWYYELNGNTWNHFTVTSTLNVNTRLFYCCQHNQCHCCLITECQHFRPFSLLLQYWMLTTDNFPCCSNTNCQHQITLSEHWMSTLETMSPLPVYWLQTT